MENIKEESCVTDSKKCCTKSIVIIIVCSLVCFLLGYYFGYNSNSNTTRFVGQRINRPFSRNPQVPNIQRRQMRPPATQPTRRINQQNMPKRMPPIKPVQSSVQNTKVKDKKTQSNSVPKQTKNKNI